MTAPARRWLSPRECAELLGLSVSGIRKMLDRGEIPAVRLGRAVRIPVDRLEARLEKQLSGACRCRAEGAR